MSNLLQLRTDLKSLKYGKDRLDGGDSGQPYIKKDINDANPTNSGLTAVNKDFLLRGGTAALSSAGKDAARLAKYFFDLKSPSGFLFIGKQNLLSQTGVETQATLKPNEGVYTPLSTLAQSITNIAGVHLNKQGLNPIPGGPKSLKTYTDVKSKVEGGNDGSTNRLVELFDTKIKLDKNLPITSTSKYNNISSLSGTLLSYGGGPGSILGIGETNIPVYSERTGINSDHNLETHQIGRKNSNTDFSDLLFYNPIQNFGSSITTGVSTKYEDELPFPTTRIGEQLSIFNGLIINPDGSLGREFSTSVYQDNSITFNSPRSNDNKTVTWTQKLIAEQTINKDNPGSSQQDFRTKIIDNPNSKYIMSLAPSYNPGNGKTIGGTKGSRIHMTSPGLQGNRKNYVKGKELPSGISVVDEINFQPIYEFGKVREDDDIKKNDLVKFRIAALNKNNPSLKQFIHFRAFINSFSDSYGAKWTGQSFMGRGEEFYKYGGFSRDISISFTVAAQSKPELMAQYKKLNFLASNLAPTYSDYGYMGGPLVQFTMGGWCYELPGFIGSLGLGVPQESPWEIGINTEGSSDSTVKEMPHIVNVDLKFTPIHRFRPEKQENTYKGDKNEVDSYGPQRYIELTNGYNNNYVPVSLANAKKGVGERNTTLNNLYSK